MQRYLKIINSDNFVSLKEENESQHISNQSFVSEKKSFNMSFNFPKEIKQVYSQKQDVKSANGLFIWFYQRLKKGL